MAALCAKCGATLPSDGPGFCPACGAPVGVAAPTVAVPPPGPVAAAPAGVYSQPQGGGNRTLKIVLIVVAVVVVLGVLGTAAVGYLGYSALHKAGASFSAGNGAQVSADDLGIDAYPGATHVDQGSMRANFGGNLMVTSAFSTTDPPSQVVSFYQDKLGPNAEVSQTSRGTTLERATQMGGNSDSLLITVSPGEQDGQTKIVIVHSRANHQ